MQHHLIQIILLIISILLPGFSTAEEESQNKTWLNDGAQIDANEVVVFFPTAGFLEAGQWVLPIEALIHEPNQSEALQKLLATSIELVTRTPVTDMTSFWQRVAPLAADNERFEQITLQLGNKTYPLPRSNAAGRISTLLRIAPADLTPNAQGWVSYSTTSQDQRVFTGWVQLVPPQGQSIISDIDDTIKVTEIPQGTRAMLANTFLKTPQPTPGFPQWYQQLAQQGQIFHYLSGGPNQLYEGLLQAFIQDYYPLGSVSLKEFRINPLSTEFWEAIASGATEAQKQAAITTLMQHFPQRRFILIGDSGEHDPEIYGWALQQPFGSQIDQVYIRNVTHDHVNSARMKAAFGSHIARLALIDPLTAQIQSKELHPGYTNGQHTSAGNTPYQISH